MALECHPSPCPDICNNNQMQERKGRSIKPFTLQWHIRTTPIILNTSSRSPSTTCYSFVEVHLASKLKCLLPISSTNYQNAFLMKERATSGDKCLSYISGFLIPILNITLWSFEVDLPYTMKQQDLKHLIWLNMHPAMSSHKGIVYTCSGP